MNIYAVRAQVQRWFGIYLVSQYELMRYPRKHTKVTS